MTGKERAELRARASGELTLFQIGKDGLAEALATAIGDALAARELVKIRVLETSGFTAREAAEQLAPQLSAEIVQVIGSRFVLYRKQPEQPAVKGKPSGTTRRMKGRKPPVGNKMQAGGNKSSTFSSKTRSTRGKRSTGSARGIGGRRPSGGAQGARRK